jgi:hypothetical protein
MRKEKERKRKRADKKNGGLTNKRIITEQTKSWTDRQTDAKTENRWTDRQTDAQTGKQMDRRTKICVERHIDEPA